MYTWTRPDGSSVTVPFYLGLALLLASFATPWARRRIARCRPLLSRRAGDRVIAAMLAAGVIALATTAAVNAASPASTTRSGHSSRMSMPAR